MTADHLDSGTETPAKIVKGIQPSDPDGETKGRLEERVEDTGPTPRSVEESQEPSGAEDRGNWGGVSFTLTYPVYKEVVEKVPCWKSSVEKLRARITKSKLASHNISKKLDVFSFEFNPKDWLAGQYDPLRQGRRAGISSRVHDRRERFYEFSKNLEETCFAICSNNPYSSFRGVEQNSEDKSASKMRSLSTPGSGLLWFKALEVFEYVGGDNYEMTGGYASTFLNLHFYLDSPSDAAYQLVAQLFSPSNFWPFGEYEMNDYWERQGDVKGVCDHSNDIGSNSVSNELGSSCRPRNSVEELSGGGETWKPSNHTGEVGSEKSSTPLKYFLGLNLLRDNPAELNKWAIDLQKHCLAIAESVLYSDSVERDLQSGSDQNDRNGVESTSVLTVGRAIASEQRSGKSSGIGKPYVKIGSIVFYQPYLTTFATLKGSFDAVVADRDRDNSNGFGEESDLDSKESANALPAPVLSEGCSEESIFWEGALKTPQVRVNRPVHQLNDYVFCSDRWCTTFILSGEIPEPQVSSRASMLRIFRSRHKVTESSNFIDLVCLVLREEAALDYVRKKLPSVQDSWKWVIKPPVGLPRVTYFKIFLQTAYRILYLVKCRDSQLVGNDPGAVSILQTIREYRGEGLVFKNVSVELEACENLSKESFAQLAANTRTQTLAIMAFLLSFYSFLSTQVSTVDKHSESLGFLGGFLPLYFNFIFWLGFVLILAYQGWLFWLRCKIEKKGRLCNENMCWLRRIFAIFVLNWQKRICYWGGYGRLQ